jgi:ornithine cyclodeaminase/alanine dehydrogenase-like protein (mu-crystallin family)
MRMRYIDEPTVASVLRMQDLIPVMRQAMIDYSQGRIAQPARRIFGVPQHGGFFGSMPAASANALGAKLVTFYPGNAEKNLHTHMAVILLFRPETGEPMVIMDGRLITEMRTAAVTATYIDAVAALDVKTLAILGAGTQGKSHIEALSHVRKFEEIRIWNRTRERAEQVAEAVGGKVTSREEAVREAEVVVVATSSAEPVLEGKWLRRGAKVATVGWGGADAAEVDAATMSHVIIVDSREGALAESGNIRRFNAEIYAELGEVLAGTRRVNPAATVVFDSIGMACEDIAAATLVYDKLGGQS